MGMWPESKFFPSPSLADAEGIVCIGGELSVDCLVDAYCHGIFPWPVSVEGMEDELMVWWSPDPRAIVKWNTFHVPRRLARKMRNSDWVVTADRHFSDVMLGCATENTREGNTWINEEILNAYHLLHRAGYAHSVEVVENGKLVGGVYGVSVGSMFAAESMFYRKPDASKIAIVALMRHLQRQGFTLFDIQQMTPHMASCGAVNISRHDFLKELRFAIEQRVQFGELSIKLSSPPEWFEVND